MKQSKYNVEETGPKGEVLLYNYRSGAFLVPSEEQLEALHSCNASQHDELRQLGFLVDDSLDEQQILRDQFSAYRKDTSVLSLNLAPTYACNCRCVYCYEKDKAVSKTVMSQQVRNALYKFVEDLYEQQHFQHIDVEWYGGDPTMCLDVVEEIAQHLIAFCDERGLEYSSFMLSNCTLMGAEEVALLKRCKVSQIMITIDGPEELHNKRRPAVGIENPYRNIIEAIKLLKAAGIEIMCVMNTDKVNAPLLPQLQEELMRECGVSIASTKLNNYSQTFGEAPFAEPDFSLYNHVEYAKACHKMTIEAGADAAAIRARLEPFCGFCAGQKENYFSIDNAGDVYKCDGWMGDTSRKLFNLLEDEPVLDAVTFDPFEDDRCKDCLILPTCWGNCSWERERCGWPCHPLKYTQKEYLQSLHKALNA